MPASSRPYDTLEEVIGLRGDKNSGSLLSWGIGYKEVPLLVDGQLDLETISQLVSTGNLDSFHSGKAQGKPCSWLFTFPPCEFSIVWKCMCTSTCMTCTCSHQFLEASYFEKVHEAIMYIFWQTCLCRFERGQNMFTPLIVMHAIRWTSCSNHPEIMWIFTSAYINYWRD